MRANYVTTYCEEQETLDHGIGTLLQEQHWDGLNVLTVDQQQFVI